MCESVVWLLVGIASAIVVGCGGSYTAEQTEIFERTYQVPPVCEAQSAGPGSMVTGTVHCELELREIDCDAEDCGPPDRYYILSLDDEGARYPLVWVRGANGSLFSEMCPAHDERAGCPHAPTRRNFRITCGSQVRVTAEPVIAPPPVDPTVVRRSHAEVMDAIRGAESDEERRAIADERERLLREEARRTRHAAVVGKFVVSDICRVP